MWTYGGTNSTYTRILIHGTLNWLPPPADLKTEKHSCKLHQADRHIISLPQSNYLVLMLPLMAEQLYHDVLHLA